PRCVPVPVLGHHRRGDVDDYEDVERGLTALRHGGDGDTGAAEGECEHDDRACAQSPSDPPPDREDCEHDAARDQDDGECEECGPRQERVEHEVVHSRILHARSSSARSPRPLPTRGTTGLSWKRVTSRPSVSRASVSWTEVTMRSTAPLSDIEWNSPSVVSAACSSS